MSPEPVYALLADGSAVLIRAAGPADLAAVRAMHQAMSPDNAYLRFFSISALAAEQEARRVCQEPAPGHAALLALCGAGVVGCASYEPMGDGKAEVAFAVADHMHHKGIATLLLEHLVSCGREEGVTAFFAETLAENTPMLRVFTDAGLPVQRRYNCGIVELTIPLPRDDAGAALGTYLSAVDEREGTADTASLRHLLAPRSIAVIGAEPRPGGTGRAIFDNIRTGGYQGQLYPVHPRARHLAGVRCVPSVADLPEAPDLAIIAVPADEVSAAAEACGMRGARALLVVTAGLGDGTQADLLAACRRHGMRLTGPGSLGLAVPEAGLDATLAASHPRAGVAGLITQSGGLGLAIADQLSRLGVGLSSFASVGAKLDVSGNDLLLWWEHDGTTKLAIMCVDSFGNPRKFARIARRVAASIPVLTVYPWQSAERQPAVGQQRALYRALFEQAGVIAVTDPFELAEVAALLATQPVPDGRRVAIVSNVRAASARAATVCSGLGLTVDQPRGSTRRRLRALVPEGGSVTGPVDLTATVSSGAFQRTLQLLAADDNVDAIIAIITPTAVSPDLTAVIGKAAGLVPVAMVVLDQAESVRLLDGADGRRIPAYDTPEAAARAMARAAAYGKWRAEPTGLAPAFPDVAVGSARDLVHSFLMQRPVGGWLSPREAASLLACYGLTLQRVADDTTGIRIHVTDDHVFGPLISLDLDGEADGAPADQAARLTPLTTADADRLLDPVRSAAFQTGHGGSDPAPRLDALRDLLLRVARLAEDLPEISELSLAPVIARDDGVLIADAQMRVAPFESRDPFLRRLRLPREPGEVPDFRDLVVWAVSPSGVDAWGARVRLGGQWSGLGMWRSQTRSKISSVLPLNQIWSS
jgi:acyl-CoA synthetase (NDP forming)/GNAT superfamily N-acetyltransferase